MRFCGEGKVYFQEPECAGVSIAHCIKDHAMHAFLTLHSPTDQQRLIRTRRLDGLMSPTFSSSFSRRQKFIMHPSMTA